MSDLDLMYPDSNFESDVENHWVTLGTVTRSHPDAHTLQSSCADELEEGKIMLQDTLCSLWREMHGISI